MQSVEDYIQVPYPGRVEESDPSHLLCCFFRGIGDMPYRYRDLAMKSPADTCETESQKKGDFIYGYAESYSERRVITEIH